MQPSRVQFADSLRGVACLSVGISHYCGVFWTGGPVIPLIANVPPLPADIAPPYLYGVVVSSNHFNTGAFGVALFFLISGFVIPLSLDRLGTFSFLRARCWRIGPTYAVGFLFTVGAGARLSGLRQAVSLQPDRSAASHRARSTAPARRSIDRLCHMDAGDRGLLLSALRDHRAVVASRFDAGLR